MNKLERLCQEWLESHPNVRGTGKYSLTYSSHKRKRGLESNYEGDIYVSPRGRVFKIFKGGIGREIPYRIILDARGNRTPHGEVHLRVHGKRISLSRLVATVWVNNPKPSKYNIVMHLDNNKFNNSFLNLRWGTQSMNIRQALKEGRLPTLFVSGPSNPSFGKRQSPLSLAEEAQIVSEVLSGQYTKVEVVKRHNISRSCINPILKRNGKF